MSQDSSFAVRHSASGLVAVRSADRGSLHTLWTKPFAFITATRWVRGGIDERLPCLGDPAAYIFRHKLQSTIKSCTSGRAGGLICEPLKAVWPAYAGIVTRISLVDRASYLLSLVPLCTLESGLHPAPPLTRNSPSPKSSVPQSSSPDP